LTDPPAGRRAGKPAAIAAIAPCDAILLQLLLGGPSQREQLVAAFGGDDASLLREIARLEDATLVVRQQIGGRETYTLAASGRERATAIVASEALLLRPHVAAIDDRFAALNRRVKEILLRWQVRVDGATEVPNDHRDARYDAGVLAELRAVQASADELLEGLAPLRTRYASLRARLRDALARASAGERSAVAGVTGDSFHTAWWQLHGDLLAMLGRARSSADA
jgi:pyruvate,orthophosphate dikinase